MEYQLGDVIEFKEESGLWVGRIDCIYHHVGQLAEDDSEWELWLEYYSEVPQRSYVKPENVVRVIERGLVNYEEKKPKYEIGQKIHFEESGKMLFDIINMVIHRHDLEDGADCFYRLKYSGYDMEEDEFEAL